MAIRRDANAYRKGTQTWPRELRTGKDSPAHKMMTYLAVAPVRADITALWRVPIWNQLNETEKAYFRKFIAPLVTGKENPAEKKSAKSTVRVVTRKTRPVAGARAVLQLPWPYWMSRFPSSIGKPYKRPKKFRPGVVRH